MTVGDRPVSWGRWGMVEKAVTPLRPAGHGVAWTVEKQGLGGPTGAGPKRSVLRIPFVATVKVSVL